jgi:hypothetical protein
MNKRDQSFRMEGLRYALSIVEGRRVLKRPEAYLAALDEIEIFLKAAIDRVGRGDPMYSVAVVQSVKPASAAPPADS